MKFEQLLISTLDNSNEIREQAELTINEYKESNYQHFLLKIIKHILKTSNPTSFYISFTIILQDIRSRKLFEDMELFYTFLTNFKDVLGQIFQMQKLNDATCNILSTILASISKLPSTDIEQFLITSMDQFPELQSFFIDTLATILLDTDFNTTPFDVLISILSLPNSSYQDYNCKFFLIFGIIQHFPDNKEELYPFISQYISEITEESVRYALNLFSSYIKSLKDFFNEFIDHIFAFITNSIETYSDDLPIQAEAIECLTNISISYQESYDIIHDSLLIILQMLEIERDKDDGIDFILKESIHTISNNIHDDISSSIFLTALSSIHDEKDFHYSYLISISELQLTTFYLSNHTVDYYHQIATFLTHPSSPDFFRIKMAGYLAIENLCCIIGPMFQEDNFNELFPLLCHELLTENDLNLIELILRCLSKILSKVKIGQLDESITSLFSYLLQILVESKVEAVMTEAIVVIINLANSLSSSFIDLYPSLIQAINQIDLSSSPELAVPLIRLLSEIVQIDSIQNLNKEDVMPLFQYSIEMLNRVECESDFDHVSIAIISFINFFGTEISSLLVDHIVPLFISSASTEIEITHLPEEAEVDSVPGFVRVSPSDFAKESSIRLVLYSLRTILDSLVILKSDFEPFSSPVFEIVSGWITFDFPLDDVKFLCWRILSLMNRWIENVDTNLTVQLFLNVAQNEVNSKKACSVMVKAIDLGIEREKFNMDLVLKLLETFSESLHSKFDRVSENSEEEEEYDDEQFSNDFLVNETLFFKFCLKKFPEITVDFYRQFIVPNLPQMSQYRHFFFFVSKVTTLYISVSNDLTFFDHFQNFLFEKIEDIQSEEAKISMKMIGRIIDMSENVGIPQEFITSCFEKMGSIFTHKDSFENDSLQLFSETIISFTKLISKHWGEIDQKIGLRLWFESLSMLLCFRKNSLPFDFLAFLIREKTADFLCVVDAVELVGFLVDRIECEAVSSESRDVFVSFVREFVKMEGNPFEGKEDDEVDEKRRLKLEMLLKSCE